MVDTTLLATVADAVRAAGKLAPGVTILAETRLVDDLGLDSLDIVGVIMKIEDRFGLQIDVDEVPNFERVSDILEYVTKLRGESAAA
ncbi:MAG TPA: acyl carrier protein [Isosphaeraceae bacterium]|jgi:acyl carrier protein|nr:acyl carrier protein [Isosphaeraceae bacterium]